MCVEKKKKKKKICKKDKENSPEVVKIETIVHVACALSICTHMKHKLGRAKTKSLSPSSMKEDRERICNHP